jgi:NAD(P)-dependent dehydrogenase (short-subunit alcohol dehydrogenase family)
MDVSAKDKRVLVTAGASGIGRVMVETFLEHGARVHLCDIDDAALAKVKGEVPRSTQTRADVASLADVERLFEDVRRHLGGLDVLVNNAGIAGPTGRVEDLEPGDWDRCIAIDLSGMFYCTRKAMPLIKEAGGGSIINLSSVAGRLGFAMRTPYSAAKWGVVGFTKSLAVEAGPDNVRVNCLQPGIVEGERIERVIAAKAKALGKRHEEVRDLMLASTSMRTTVTHQDIANMALFLASDAGKHISGQQISICGDMRYLT